MQQLIQFSPTNNKYSEENVKKTYRTTVGSKYQLVIPKEIREKMNLKPGDKLYADILNRDTIYLMVPKKNWANRNYGALKKYWQGVDMIEEVEKIRNEEY